MKRLTLALTFVVGLWSSSAQAAPIFVDHFDTEHGGVGELNYAAFANWDVIGPGSVDLIPLAPGADPNGPYDFLGQAGMPHGLYVDLDGTSDFPGRFQLKNGIPLVAGNYTLSFFLAGNFRNWSPDTVDFSIFSPSTIYSSMQILRNATDVNVFSIPFTLTGADTVKFAFHNSGADYRGALLDDVELNADLTPTAVPEPGSLVLLGTGMLYLGRRVRQRMRAN